MRSIEGKIVDVKKKVLNKYEFILDGLLHRANSPFDALFLINLYNYFFQEWTAVVTRKKD